MGAKNMKLRNWTKEDAPALAAVINNKKIQDNLRDGIPYPYSNEDAADYIDGLQSAVKDSQYTFAITYNDKVIGCIGVIRQDNIHCRTAELGYYLAEPYWGQGVMTKAVRQICAYVFAQTDILRVFAEPFDENHASCRVLEKAGFQLEGILRQNAVKNARVLDMRMYALLKEGKAL